MKTTETFSPTLAKIVLSIASVLGTLGGWAALSLGAARTGAGSSAGDPVATPPRPERKVVPARHTARERPLRQVDAPPPPPVTFTRSSR